MRKIFSIVLVAVVLCVVSFCIISIEPSLNVNNSLLISDPAWPGDEPESTTPPPPIFFSIEQGTEM